MKKNKQEISYTKLQCLSAVQNFQIGCNRTCAASQQLKPPVVWVAATSGWTSEEAPCTGKHTALRRQGGVLRTRSSSLGGSNLGVNLGGCPVHWQTRGIATIGWSLTHEVPRFGWQPPRGEPRRMTRARGVRRGLGQSWDRSAVRVERKLWSYLGVSPEVAVCLVATTVTQAGSVESHARDPVLWVTAASGWSSEEASCTGIASRTRANSRSKCHGSREKAMILPRS